MESSLRRRRHRALKGKVAHNRTHIFNTRLQTEPLEERRMLSASPELLADLNVGRDGSYPNDSVVFQGERYFFADDGTHGKELWMTDGTESGTVLVKDIQPGPGSSASYGDPAPVVAGDTLYFWANDGTHGTELWKSDGTEAGTTMVRDIWVGPQSAGNKGMIEWEDRLIFIARDSTNNHELWTTDGTQAGTTLLAEIRPGTSGGFGSPVKDPLFTPMNGELYFIADNDQLWKTDGTPESTSLVQDYISFGGSLEVFNSHLYFAASKPQTVGRELWKSDGTSAGTVLLKDINPGPDSSDPGHFEEMNGLLYFRAEGTNRPTIWRTDGTEAGTEEVVQLNAIGGDPGPSDLTNVDGTIYFIAQATGGSRGLWKTDGTAIGTTLVKSIRPVSNGAVGTSPFTVFGGEIYFTANDGGNGVELWKSDGTTEGTAIFHETLLGPDSSSPGNLAVADGTLLFTTGTTSRQWWRTDGTPETTTKIGPEFDGIRLHDLAGGGIYFSAGDSLHGGELWKTDLTDAGTVLVKDINTGSAAPSSPKLFVEFQGFTYFVANDSSEIWRTDGTTAGTEMAIDARVGAGSASISSLIAFDGSLYFSAFDPVHGQELWKSDGTDAGTVLFSDLRPGLASSSPGRFVVHNGRLYFIARDGSQGTDLHYWATDGTLAGTVKLSNNGPDIAALPQTAVGDTMYFVSDGDLYTTDGTPEGTTQLKSFTFGTTNLVNVNGTLYFAANDGIHGKELWKSDGTVAGTQLVKDLRSGSPSSGIGSLVNVNGKLYFGNTIVGVQDYFELWTSDGTETGTEQIFSIAIDEPSSVSLYPAGDQVFFAPDSDAYGTEWFVSDGTVEGTRLVKDIRAGTLGTTIRSPGVVNDTLFFSVVNGTETTIWTSDGTDAGTVPIGPVTSERLDGVFDIEGTAYFALDEPWVLRFPSVSVDLDGSSPSQGLQVFWPGSPVPISAPNATLNSAGTLVQSLTARLLNPQPGDLLSVETTGTAVVASFDGTTLTLTGEDTVEHYEQLLRSIMFQSAGGIAQARIEVRAQNSSGHAAVPSITTVVFNTAPTLDLNGVAEGENFSVVSQGAAVYVTTPTAMIDDSDSAQLSKLELTILQAEPGDLLVADTAGTNITATFDGSKLTLTGLESVGLYQQVLRSVLYNYAGASPTVGSKQIEVIATDAEGQSSQPAITMVGFILYVDLNTPWGATGHSTTWNGSPVNVALPTASILAAGEVDIASINIEIANAEADDLLLAATAGTNITAVYNGGILTLSGVDSRVNYEQVLRSVKYHGITPTAPSKLVRVRVTDEFGSQSNQATSTIQILWDAFIEPVRDIVPGTGNSDARQFADVNGTAFFTALSAGRGFELWKSDGTEAGTVLVKDIRPGDESSDIQRLTNVGDFLMFTADAGTGTALWKSDGTVNGTIPVWQGNPGEMVEVDGLLYFTSSDELWKSDGTVVGTVLVKDFNVSFPSQARHLTAVGDLLFFGMDDGVHGEELWKSDGTESGTALVKDIRPGSGDGLQPGFWDEDYSALELVNVNGVLYFVASSNGQNPSVWKTDGTEVGTEIYIDAADFPFTTLGPSSLTNFNGSLYMVAQEYFYGIEIFHGAGIAVDINHTEQRGSNPQALTVAGDSIFFTAYEDDDTQIRKFWAHTPGQGSELISETEPDDMVAVGDWMFFSSAGQLWRSDGTAAGTHPVEFNGTHLSADSLGSVGDALYFTSNAGKGDEPYILRTPTAETSVAGRHLFYHNSKFAMPSPNPFAGKDGAVATDKVAYVADQGTANTSSISSYVHGINGVVVDVFNTTGVLTADDFAFRMGSTNSPDSWTVAPAPLAVVIRPGLGQGNSDRVEITWADGAIKNTWLQVVVKGNDVLGGFNTNTGLAESDVFYFGSRIGDTFENAAPLVAVTSAFDEVQARTHAGFSLPITNPYDFNRDGIVSAADQVIARTNGGFLPMLDLSPPEAAPLVAASPLHIESEVISASKSSPSSASSERSAVAFALATFGTGDTFGDDAVDALFGDGALGRRFRGR